MKNLKTKVIMSAIVLVFALVATIGSTYAWFTVSNEVAVSSFNVTVESNEALLMKVYDGETYVQGQAYTAYQTNDAGNFWTLDDFSNSIAITDSALYTGGAESISNALLSPVTVLAGETASGDADYDELSVTNLRKPTTDFIKDVDTVGRELVAGLPNTPTGGYIQIKIWALNPADVLGAATDVTLSYTISDNNPEQTYDNAIWVGTYWDKNQDGNQTNDSASEFIFAKDGDLDFEWISTTPGFATDGSLNVLPDAADTVTEIDATKLGVEGTSAVVQLNTVKVPELLTINIWAEGWDKDTVNAIMGASFTIAFTFELK